MVVAVDLPPAEPQKPTVEIIFFCDERIRPHLGNRNIHPRALFKEDENRWYIIYSDNCESA